MKSKNENHKIVKTGVKCPLILFYSENQLLFSGIFFLSSFPSLSLLSPLCYLISMLSNFRGIYFFFSFFLFLYDSFI